MKTYWVRTFLMYNSAEPDPEYDKQEVLFTGLTNEQRDRLVTMAVDSVNFDAESGEE